MVIQHIFFILSVSFFHFTIFFFSFNENVQLKSQLDKKTDTSLAKRANDDISPFDSVKDNFISSSSIEDDDATYCEKIEGPRKASKLKTNNQIKSSNLNVSMKRKVQKTTNVLSKGSNNDYPSIFGERSARKKASSKDHLPSIFSTISIADKTDSKKDDIIAAGVRYKDCDDCRELYKEKLAKGEAVTEIKPCKVNCVGYIQRVREYHHNEKMKKILPRKIYDNNETPSGFWELDFPMSEKH